MTARRCGWLNFWVCGELLYEKWFSLELKGAVYKIYIRPAILYGSESWCLKERDILQRTETDCCESNLWSTAL